MINAGIIGATTYVGMELTRLLQYHPNVNVSAVISQNYIGQKISNIYPNLNQIFEANLESLDIEKLIYKADIFFTCIPIGISKVIMPSLVESSKKIIDFSNNFLFNSKKLYEKWFKQKHDMPFLLQSSSYGLTELYKESIKNSLIVGVPTNYSTSVILSLAPLLKNNLLKIKSIMINIISSLSDEGRCNDFIYHFCESSENIRFQKDNTSFYKSEINKEIENLSHEESDVILNHFVAPVKRGQLCTIVVETNTRIKENEFFKLYKTFYKNSTFIRVLDKNILSETKWVIGSNYFDISAIVEKEKNRITIISSMDNMIKGSAGQAIQCLNIMYGFSEKLGLDFPGFYI
ncbi:MAG: N-acetyl-gamma-glutamyl-phosphate reductase [Clostridiales bacterium]